MSTLFSVVTPYMLTKPWEINPHKGCRYGKSTKYTKNLGKKKRINRKHRRK